MKAGPLVESLPPEKGPLDRSTAVGSGEATDLAQTDGKSVLDRDVAAEVRLVEKKRSRRKRKGRRKRHTDSLAGRLRYCTGVLGAFGWTLVGLSALWLGSLVLALVWPGLGQWLLLVGNGLVLIGNVWIAFIAYQDSQVFGMLCFGTCLFTYVYIFMNLEETRRPAALTGLGFVFVVSGLLLPS